MLGILLDRGGQLFHRRGGFLEAGGLLLGAARQVVVAGGDFAGGGIDAERGGLDAADDPGQLRDRGVGVVAHRGEHAVELAVHACGQVAAGEGLQQFGQVAQVAVAVLHHGVEVLHHQAEIVLELRCIAAHAEVAGGGRGGQTLDLGVDRQQAGLGRVHRLVQYRAAAGQAPCIAAQVAVGVFVEHRDRIDDGVQVLKHHGVDALAELAVDAGEIQRHAMAHVLVGMQFDHQRGFAGKTLQLRLHALHCVQQAGRLVAPLGADVVVHAAVGDRFGGAGGALQRLGQAAGDRPGQQAADQQHADAAGDQRIAPVDHRLGCRGVGKGSLLALAGNAVTDRFLPGVHRCAARTHQHRLRLGLAACHGAGDDRIVRDAGDVTLLGHHCAVLHALRIGGGGEQHIAVAVVALALAVDGRFGRGHVVGILGHGQVAQRDRDAVVGIQQLAP